MAIRKMRVSFDIDISIFLKFLAEANQAMRVDVYGDDKVPRGLKLLNGGHTDATAKPKLLQAPKRAIGARKPAAHRGSTETVFAILLAQLTVNKPIHLKELTAAVVARGGSPKSTSPQIAELRKEHLIKKVDVGTYQITAKGIAKHAKIMEAAKAETANG